MKQVRVRWLDSVSLGDEWTDAADLGVHDEDVHHTSVGWLARKSKVVLVVCASRQNGTARFQGCIAIPRKAVVSVENIA